MPKAETLSRVTTAGDFPLEFKIGGQEKILPVYAAERPWLMNPGLAERIKVTLGKHCPVISRLRLVTLLACKVSVPLNEACRFLDYLRISTLHLHHCDA